MVARRPSSLNSPTTSTVERKTTLSPEADFCSLGLELDLLISLQVSCFVHLEQWMKRTLSDRLGQSRGRLDDPR